MNGNVFCLIVFFSGFAQNGQVITYIPDLVETNKLDLYLRIFLSNKLFPIKNQNRQRFDAISPTFRKRL